MRRAASLIGCPSTTSSTASIRRYNRASRATDNARSRRRRSVGENRRTADLCPRMPASVAARSDWYKTSGYLLRRRILRPGQPLPTSRRGLVHGGGGEPAGSAAARRVPPGATGHHAALPLALLG